MKITPYIEDWGFVQDSRGNRFRVRGNFPWLNNPSCEKYVIARPRPQFRKPNEAKAGAGK